MITRRDLGKVALAAFPVSRLLAKPNSKFGGVQVGINAPYSFRGMPGKAEDIVKYMQQLGLSGVELRSQPVEGWMGAPAIPGGGRNQTPEQRAAGEQATAHQTQRRQSAAVLWVKKIRKW